MMVDPRDADRPWPAHGRGLAVLLAVGTLLLSGCASMPGSGSVQQVDSPQRAEGESRVRVFGVTPQKGEGPQQIVRGFLEATTSDEPRFSTAKQYLTRETAKSWDPFASTAVVTDGPSTGAARQDPGDEGGYTVRVQGDRVALVNGGHAYDTDSGTYAKDFHLTKVANEGWRIDRLPAGLVLGEADFERIYRSVDVYYYAELGPGSGSVSGGNSVLVADPVYLRGRINPLTETVRTLLGGPTSWLDPVVNSAFPEGAGLASEGDRKVSMDDEGGLRVRLNDKVAEAGRGQCVRMAAQLLYSVQSQASAKVNGVELTGPEDGTLCELSREDAESYAPGRLSGRATHQYFIDDQQRVASVPIDSGQSEVVQGPLGSGQVEFGSVGVSRDERYGAAVSRNGRELYVSALSGAGPLGDPVLLSEAGREANRLSAPSWDGLGDLWVADRNPDDPRLMRLRGGRETAEEVDVPGLGKGERIEALRISSDGVRIAMRIREADGHSSLQLGRVERSGTEEDPEVTVAALRPVAPQLQDVVAVSWAGDSQLVVVGRESKSVQQLQYVGTDGSTANQPTLPGINDVTNVAASENEGKPLLAESEYGMVRLPPDANWRTLPDPGTAPVYPG